MEHLHAFFALLTSNPVGRFVMMIAPIGFIVALLRLLFFSRKIQPDGFRWKAIRNELVFAAINTSLTGFFLGGLTALLNKYHLIQLNHQPARWWTVLLEYAVYFVLFDTWFYWWHRLMHIGWFYTLVHKIHHFSTSPNILTTFSVSPLESLVNGGFLSLFTAAVVVHDQSLPFMGLTTILMGFYVHSGYEFLPRWWNKTWLTKWFITATFHDQHHKYFRWNFGGYTTVWDRICGTMRPKYEADFDQIKARVNATALQPASLTVVAILVVAFTAMATLWSMGFVFRPSLL
jgi:Delta7-sterol 5-desaturase